MVMHSAGERSLREGRVRTAFAKAPEYGMGFVTPSPDAEG
jgi:hypothetical protein